MSRIVLTIHNVHTWGKPQLTRSGDVNILEDVANNIQKRKINSYQTINEVVYAAITEDNIRQLEKLYPSLTFTHFAEFRFEDEDTLIIPMIDARGQELEFANELKEFYRFISKKKHVLMNICRQDDYYDNLIQSQDDQHLGDLIKRVILTSQSYMTHHSSNSLPLDNNLNIHQIAHPQNQLLSFEFSNNVSQNDKDENKTIVFNRPSSMKGFPLWLKDMMSDKETASKSVYVGNISGLSQIKKIKEQFYEKYGKEFNDAIQLFESIDDYSNKEHYQNSPKVINSGYQKEEIKELASNFGSFIVSSDYNYISGDYVMIEYAMLEALQYGLRLYWCESSIQSMKDNHKFNAAKDAIHFNHMTYNEQIKYFSEAFSPDLFVDQIIKASKEV